MRSTMLTQDEMKNQVELHRWPLSEPTTYVAKGAMMYKLLWSVVALAVIFGLGAVWILMQEPGHNVAAERARGKEVIKQCCLQDIRSFQEALTAFSAEVRKFQVHLATDLKKD